MLRITRAEEGSVTQFKLEGKLAGSFVEAMEQSWQQAITDFPARAFVIDLSAVTYVDAKGTELLTEMHRYGAELRASTCLIKAIVEDIKSRSGEPARTGH
jgi:anti-anti-sigma regulatory factor